MLPRQIYKTCLTIFMLFALGIVFAQAGVLTVKSNNANYGTVKIGSGTASGTVTSNVSSGQKVTISATPKTGYKFTKWNDGNTTANRQITISNNNNITYTATFAINTYTLTIKTATNNTTQGTVHFAGETAGATATKTVNHGSGVNILATPTGCYRFKQWNDGNTNASRTVTVTAAKTYTATFEQTTYSGTCGTNVKWTFNECTGALSITGTGAMTNYSSGNSPWYSYRASITSATIANTVTSIGNYAFYHCDNLTSISIGTGVTSIGTETFWYCGKLPSVTIPSGVTSIGSWAFESCSSLKDIYVSWTTAAAIPTWTSMTTGTASNITLHVPCGSGDIYRAANGWKNYTITGSGTAQYTLTVKANNSALGTVKIDNGTAGATASLKTHCEDAHTITATLNNDVGCYYFKRWSDNNYENPRKIGISANKTITAEFVEGIAGGACGETGNENKVTWHLSCDGVLTISGTGAMKNFNSTSMPWYSSRTSIKSVVIANGVTNIGNYAFYSCSSLTSVSIPSSVTTIGSYAFYNCTSLPSVTIPSSVTSISSYAFYNTGLTDIYVSWATAGAISNWSSMTQNYNIFLHVPCGTAEYYMAKAGWKEYNIRGGCNTTYTLTVASNNSALGLVQIDDNTPAPSITEQVYTDDSHRITAVPVDACHQFVRWEDGSTENPRTVMPNTNTTYTAMFEEHQYSGKCGNNLTWVLECDGTLRISGTGMMADYSYTNQPWQSISNLIKHVVIEEGVTTIGNYAFYAMKKIETVTNPSTLKTIGTMAFHSCYGLESINFPDGLTSIGRNTTGHGPLYGCHSLKSIYIPASVTMINKDAFLRCYSATSIVVDPANTVYDSRDNCNAIIETATNILLYGCQTTVIPDGVRTVSQFAFEYQHNLKSIRISNTVTSFGTTVFKECENLKDIYVEWTTTPPANILTTWYEHANLDATITIHVPCGKKNLYTSSSVWNRYQIVDDHLKGGMCGAQGSNQTWMLSCDGQLDIKGIGEMADYTAGGAPWYNHRNSIHTITFADGITSIGENAFADFTNLTDLYAPWTENIPVLPASNNPQASTTLHVPCSVMNLYQAADGWKNYTIIGEGTCTIDVNAETGGTANGGGIFNCGTTITLTATPSESYRFTQWSDGNTQNPRNITVNGNAAYTAQFEIAQYTITANAETGGTVTGGGTYTHGATATLEATPQNECYIFTQWSDGNTQNPRAVTVKADASYTAEFYMMQYNISVQSADAEKGDVTIKVND